MTPNNKPKVSVIVPNYNHGAYLRDRINCIINQTYQDFEIILLDDCSTDNSHIILEDYRNDSHVSQIVYNTINSGSPFVQWDKGINMAKGEWIWIAESDDKASLDFLSIMMEEIEKHPKTIMAYSHSFYIDDNNIVNSIDFYNKNSGETIIYDGKKYNHSKMLWNNNIFNASMVVFSRSAYDQVDKNYKNYRCCGDWLFWTCICDCGEIIEVCKELNYFRQHQRSVTKNASKVGEDWLEAASLLNTFISLLNLKGLELRYYRGKWTRDMLASRCKDKRELKNKYPRVFGASKLDIVISKICDLIKERFKS